MLLSSPRGQQSAPRRSPLSPLSGRETSGRRWRRACAHGYPVRHMVSRRESRSAKDARELARRVKAKLISSARPRSTPISSGSPCPMTASPQSHGQLASFQSWKDTIVLHSSGALTSEELCRAVEEGREVASVHPLMSFVTGKKPSWQEVTFAVEGDAKEATKSRPNRPRSRRPPFQDREGEQSAVSRLRSFASPLVIALMSAMEQVAEAAGIPSQTRRNNASAVTRDLDNYLARDAPSAFSGPLVRGDVNRSQASGGIEAHARSARSLFGVSRAAIERLPVKNRRS